MRYYKGFEYIFGQHHQVFMKIGEGKNCLQVIPSLKMMRVTQPPLSFLIQEELGKPRVYANILEEEFNIILNQTYLNLVHI